MRELMRPEHIEAGKKMVRKTSAADRLQLAAASSSDSPPLPSKPSSVPGCETRPASKPSMRAHSSRLAATASSTYEQCFLPPPTCDRSDQGEAAACDHGAIQ